MEYAIETFSLTKIFSDWWGRDKVYAVDNLNLKIRYNEVYGLLGPNGSGKTTTLKMLLGLLYPTKGRAVVLGGDSTNPKINSRIGFLPEESYLYRYLSARETLDFYGRLFGLGKNVRKIRTEALLDMVGLRAVANRAVGTFSKGMARRIGLAQALINDPELLILDEPTTGLDPIGTRQIKDLILELAKRGKTVLLCSHLLADVEDICDRISILYGGRIQTEGIVREMLRQTDKRQITAGPISDEAVERIKKIIHNEKSECDVSWPMDRLETFFIKTIATAQEENQKTSGAVSTTKVSDFLSSVSADKSHRAEILDKLVSGTELPQRPAEPVTTEKVKPAEEKKPEADKEVLKELSGRNLPEKSHAEAETKPVEAEPARKEQPDQGIIDQLTGGSESSKKDEKQTGSDQEGAGDA